MKKFLIIGFTSLLTITLSGCEQETALTFSSTQPETFTLKKEVSESFLALTGTVEADKSIKLSSKISGRIEALLVSLQANTFAQYEWQPKMMLVSESGTYWYHSHSKGQEQDGLYGPLVIYPKNKVPLTAGEKADRDYVVLLSDFHNSTSGQIMSNLKKEADYYQNR